MWFQLLLLNLYYQIIFFVMFIPISYVKSIEGSSGTVLRACLTPFKAELEDLFVNGF